MLFEITELAAEKIKEMLNEEQEEGQKLYLRVGVTGEGCGLSYGMGFDINPNEDDIYMQHYGVDVIVDKESAPMLEGVQIDFIQNETGTGFTIDNPNAVSTCGCGSKKNAGASEEC